MPRKARTKMAAYKKDDDRERSRPYTASSGLKVILTGLPPLVPQRIDASVEYPDKPSYSVETASGDIETYEHDETSLETPEDKEAWAAYVEGMNAAETDLTERLLYAVLLECVELEDYEDLFYEWKTKQELIPLPLAEAKDPEDERAVKKAEQENKFHFMQIEVFRDADDIGEILTIVMGLTGVSVEDLASARDSFPSEMESESPDGSGDTAGELEDTGE